LSRIAQSTTFTDQQNNKIPVVNNQNYNFASPAWA